MPAKPDHGSNGANGPERRAGWQQGSRGAQQGRQRLRADQAGQGIGGGLQLALSLRAALQPIQSGGGAARAVQRRLRALRDQPLWQKWAEFIQNKPSHFNMPGQAALGGLNPARQRRITRRSFCLLPQRFRLSRQRARGAFTFGQLFRGAAGDLRIRPRAAGAEIKAENAGDDAIHIAGNGIRQAKRLGKQQQR